VTSGELAQRYAPGKSKSRLDSLTGMRAFAAGMVALFHVHDQIYGSGEKVLRHFAVQGRAGVGFFFMLSGFVLTWSWRSDVNQSTFWRRRFARIYPAYLVALLLGLLIAVAYNDAAHNAAKTVVDLLLLQAWVPVGKWFDADNQVLWSLSCEAFFYAVFPAVISRLAPATVRQRRKVQAALLAVTAVVAVIGLAVASDGNASHGGTVLLFVWPPTRCVAFLFGMTLALDVRERALPRIAIFPVLGLAAVAYIALSWLPVSLSFDAWMFIPFALLLVAGAQKEAAGESWWMSNRRLVLLGEISYAYYLFHDLLIRLAAHHTYGSNASRSVVMVLAALVAVPVAYVVWRFYERPVERLLRGSPRAEAKTQMPVSI
jgi:peptidoglycan/LPS O-acetylase OafA/YrhL